MRIFLADEHTVVRRELEQILAEVFKEAVFGHTGRVRCAMNTTKIAACTTDAAASCTLHSGQRAGRAALAIAGPSFLRDRGAAAKGRLLPGRQLHGFWGAAIGNGAPGAVRLKPRWHTTG